MSLKAKAYSAVRWTALGVAGKLLMQFLQVVILARMLSISEMGLVAIVLSITTLVLAFVDAGINNVIMHRQAISHAERSELYWLNLLVGGVWSLLVAAFSPWVADFYGEPALREVLLFIAPYFVIFAAGQQLKVMAEKELLFHRLVTVELAASFTGFGVTVGLAFAGQGAGAVAMGFTAMGLVFTSLAWVFLSSGWRPNARPTFSGVGAHLKYGGYVVGNNILSGINTGADIFIGGRLLGVGGLGAYSLPRDLMLNASAVINAVATRVGLPVMAKAQADRGRLKQVYLKTVRMTASINMPIFMAVFVLAPDVVWILFGERWMASVPLLRALAVWGMLRSIAQPVGSLIFAVGRADLAMKWNFGLMFLMIPAVWAGLQYGATGLSLAMVSAGLIAQVPNWWFLVRPLCGASATEYFFQLGRPFAATLLTMGSVFLLLMAVDGHLFRLAVGFIGGGVVYVLTSMVLNRDWLVAMKEAVLRRGA